MSAVLKMMIKQYKYGIYRLEGTRISTSRMGFERGTRECALLKIGLLSGGGL
jgi:hypothetical protein